jgi:biopolymer transport protein ExbB
MKPAAPISKRRPAEMPMWMRGISFGFLVFLGTALALAAEPSAVPSSASPPAPTSATPAPASKTAPAPAPSTAASPAAEPDEPEPASGGTIRGKNLWVTLSRGGPLMIPILLCSLVAVAFTIERFVSLRQGAVAPRTLAEDVLKAVGNGGAAAGLELCQQRPSSLARVLGAGLALAGSPKEDVVAAMQETGERELWNLDRFAKPLNIIAGVSPLLGLLGTVWGMIIAFDVVAQKGALGDPKQLANGIATALLTTLAGLSVAIPAYILYHYFRGKTDRMIIEIEETSSRVVAALVGAPSHANPSPAGGDRGAAPDPAD